MGQGFATVLVYSAKCKWTPLVAYLTGITGLIVVTAMLSATITHQVLASFQPWLGKSSGVSSRVKTGLEIQARAASWKPRNRIVATPATVAPTLPVSVLASGIDGAESAEHAPNAENVSATADLHSAGETSSPEEIIAPVQLSEPAILPPLSQGPAVAGWTRRAMVRRVEAKEGTPARIIERNLRAEI